jgi:hypothetical protein
MFTTIFGAGAVGAGAASRYGSDQIMRLLAAPAPRNTDFIDIFIAFSKPHYIFFINES